MDLCLQFFSRHGRLAIPPSMVSARVFRARNSLLLGSLLVFLVALIVNTSPPSVSCCLWLNKALTRLKYSAGGVDQARAEQELQQYKVSKMKFLNQKEAQELDAQLMSSPGFSVDQLMELAGLSVACAIAKIYDKTKSKVLVVAGPGNNGGDGLVAARHLKHFGYSPTVLYPKASSKELFVNLIQQLKDLHIPLIDELPPREELEGSFDVLVDGIFGFSFHGAIRPPFDTIVEGIRQCNVPLVSIDIPSGWDVEKGDESGEGLRPEMLVSLTAPKTCAKFFQGRFHFLGGRFVPPHIKEKYGLHLPAYPGTEQCVLLKENRE